jgi:uncharacterized protein
MSGVAMDSRLYDPTDPFADKRPLDDRSNMVDHFYVKLFKLVDRFNTDAGRAEAERRTEYMRGYMSQLSAEIT